MKKAKIYKVDYKNGGEKYLWYKVMTKYAPLRWLWEFHLLVLVESWLWEVTKLQFVITIWSVSIFSSLSRTLCSHNW